MQNTNLLMGEVNTKRTLGLSPGRCWRAVLNRDSAADGSFVYAVCSTGIYCRPSCPSRRPRRRITLFFPRPDLAERAGFRPCRRCHPERSAVLDPRAEQIAELCRFIHAQPEEKFSLAALASRAGLNVFQLLRSFKRATGVTPRQYAAACRLGTLKTALRRENNVTTALYDAGYGSSSRLYEFAPAHLGMTPATYSRGGQGMQIRFSTASSPLGRLLLAATPRGICMVSLGDSDGALQAALKHEYPRASISRDRNGLSRWLRSVLAKVNGQAPSRQLPLDVQATAFQRCVWQALLEIPRGSTRTYSQIARAVGRPKAVRAVARACAANPNAVVVPCHRVIRADASLGGYRWGLSRKKALLEAERRSGL